MSRNGSGTYSLPTTFTASTDALAEDVNTQFEDVRDALTASLAIDGQTVMTGQLKSADGSITAPGMAFGSDLNTGFYRSASGVIRATLDGTNTWTVSATAVTITGDLAVSGAITQAGVALVTQARTLTAGTGMSGGGDLSANRTLTLADTAVAPGAYVRATITVDQQGRLTAAAAGASELPTQTGNSGKVLSTDGTTASWANVPFARGSVSSAGVISGAVNASAAKDSTGYYSVTLTSPAATANYTVVATPNIGSTRIVTVSGKTTGGFSVETFSVGSSPVNIDVPFEFLVFGGV